MSVGVVGGANERPRFHMSDSQVHAELGQFGEFVRMNVARHWQMLARGLQVLSEGENVHSHLGKLPNHVSDFFHVFADSQHKAGFGDGIAIASMLEDSVAAGIRGLYSNLPREGRYRLQVVRKYVWLGIEDGVDIVGIAFEIAGKNFDAHARTRRSDFGDGLGPVCGAAIAEVISVDAGYYRVLKVELAQHLRYSSRLFSVDGQGASGLYVAEAARTGANIAQDHDSQSAPRPALANVRTARAGADRVEIKLLDSFFYVEVARLGRHGDFDPRRVPPLGLLLGRLLSDYGQRTL